MVDQEEEPGPAQQQPSRYRPNLPTPGKIDIFSSSIEDTWRRWKRQWEAYEIATRLDRETPKYRTAVLLTCLGAEALEIHEGFSYDAGEDRHDIATVILSLTSISWQRQMRLMKAIDLTSVTKLKLKTLSHMLHVSVSLLKGATMGILAIV